MRLNGKWGSRHSRGIGVIGPDPPWIHDKWRRPSEWIEECQKDPVKAQRQSSASEGQELVSPR
jgi:hypothetical protein